MGLILTTASYFADDIASKLPEKSSVEGLAVAALDRLPGFHEGRVSPARLIAATTCPDRLAPSLSQTLAARFAPSLSSTHLTDVVQGCAGGLSALFLACECVRSTGRSVLVVCADLAEKAVSKQSQLYGGFGNGAFAGLVEDAPEVHTGLQRTLSRQFPELLEVVNLRLGHAAADIIADSAFQRRDPRLMLGLQLDGRLAARFIHAANSFYEEFFGDAPAPDVAIFHQVHPRILRILQDRVLKPQTRFIDISAETGNCGAAALGLALDRAMPSLAGKQVFLCSFGTGGVVTGGLWQF